jgi:hypothetical protein
MFSPHRRCFRQPRRKKIAPGAQRDPGKDDLLSDLEFYADSRLAKTAHNLCPQDQAPESSGWLEFHQMAAFSANAGTGQMSVAMVRGSIQPGGRAFHLSLVALLVSCCLIGCASSEQIREKQAVAQETLSQQDDAQCRANGAAPETPAYQECRSKLVEARAENEAVQAKRRDAFQKTTAEGTSSLTGH